MVNTQAENTEENPLPESEGDGDLEEFKDKVGELQQNPDSPIKILS